MWSANAAGIGLLCSWQKSGHSCYHPKCDLPEQWTQPTIVCTLVTFWKIRVNIDLCKAVSEFICEMSHVQIHLDCGLDGEESTRLISKAHFCMCSVRPFSERINQVWNTLPECGAAAPSYGLGAGAAEKIKRRGRRKPACRCSLSVLPGCHALSRSASVCPSRSLLYPPHSPALRYYKPGFAYINSLWVTQNHPDSPVHCSNVMQVIQHSEF